MVALLASSCASEESSPAGDLDGAVRFDGASLGKCAANDYTLVPVRECAASGCIGSAAFALCEGSSYSLCACGPPGGGWTLVEGGAEAVSDAAVSEATPGDARADAPRPEAGRD